MPKIRYVLQMVFCQRPISVAFATLSKIKKLPATVSSFRHHRKCLQGILVFWTFIGTSVKRPLFRLLSVETTLTLKKKAGLVFVVFSPTVCFRDELLDPPSSLSFKKRPLYYRQLCSHFVWFSFPFTVIKIFSPCNEKIIFYMPFGQAHCHVFFKTVLSLLSSVSSTVLFL